MADEVIARHAEFPILANAADEAVPLGILTQRKQGDRLLLDPGPGVLSTHGVYGPPAPLGRDLSQNPHVAGSSHAQAPSVQMPSAQQGSWIRMSILRADWLKTHQKLSVHHHR